MTYLWVQVFLSDDQGQRRCNPGYLFRPTQSDKAVKYQKRKYEAHPHHIHEATFYSGKDLVYRLRTVDYGHRSEVDYQKHISANKTNAFQSSCRTRNLDGRQDEIARENLHDLVPRRRLPRKCLLEQPHQEVPHRR